MKINKIGIKEKQSVFILLLGLFLLQLYFAITSTGSYGGADSYVHYRISHYAFKYPHLFLDHWGKPLFTILSSPFSQFGFIGIKIFNILTGLLTAYFCYLLAKKLNYKNAILIIIFVCFAPIYLILQTTALTEILFSFVLVLSVWFFFKEKYNASAIIISFLPFVRTEGVVLIPLFAIAYLFKHKYVPFPLLIVGFLFFSIIGSFYYNDLLWVVNKMPYTGAKDIYGSGDLFHFLDSYENTIGIPLGIMFLVGIIAIVYGFFTKKNSIRSLLLYEVLLIFFPVFLYLAFHSVLWWKGLGGSLGLIRVIVGVIPLAVIVSMKGLNFFVQPLSFNKWIKFAVLGIVLYTVVRTPFVIYQIPHKMDPASQLVKQTADWLVKTEYYHELIYYYNPFFPHVLELDPFDKDRVWERLPDRENPEAGVLMNSIVLWDAHFGPNEGRMSLDKLTNNTHFRLLKVFKPENEFKVLGGHNYEIYVFQRL